MPSEMGLDVYVGSLTRYFSGDWETTIAQYAREQGIPYRVIGRVEEEDAVTDPREVRSITAEWLQAISDATGVPLDWDEDAVEYFTDKPDWDGYGSVQVLAALVERGDQKRPEKAVTEWTNERPWKWFPAEVDVLRVPAPTGSEITIGSCDRVRGVLREVNEQTYRLPPGSRNEVEPSESFDEAARFGLTILLELAEQAVEHRLPMKLDY
jgi:hypothetical protein